MFPQRVIEEFTFLIETHVRLIVFCLPFTNEIASQPDGRPRYKKNQNCEQRVDLSKYSMGPCQPDIFFPQLRGAAPDLSAATFQIADESHTVGNALRWMIMKKSVSLSMRSIASHPLTRGSPKVEFCGYR